MNPIPPTIYSQTFSSYSATLRVPVGNKSAYETAEGWKNFTNIEEIDPTIIEEITPDLRNVVHNYDLNGRRFRAPQKGIIIMNGKKVIVNKSL